MRPEIIPFWISLLRYQELAAADVVEFQIVADVASVVVPRQGIFLQGVEADQHQIWVPSQPPKNTDILRHTHLAGPFSIYVHCHCSQAALERHFLHYAHELDYHRPLWLVSQREFVQRSNKLWTFFSWCSATSKDEVTVPLFVDCPKRRRPHNVWRCCEKKPQPEYPLPSRGQRKDSMKYNAILVWRLGARSTWNEIAWAIQLWWFLNQSQSSQSILHCFPRLLKTACVGKIC